jgi:hypothetical protein
MLQTAQLYRMCFQLTRNPRDQDFGLKNRSFSSTSILLSLLVFFTCVQVPLLESVSTIGAGIGCTCYFALMVPRCFFLSYFTDCVLIVQRDLCILFSISSIVYVIAVIINATSSKLPSTPSDIIISTSIGNVITARWKGTLSANIIAYSLSSFPSSQSFVRYSFGVVI